MADASSITVAVESVIHDALKTVIQAIETQHHIRVTDVSVNWLETSTVGAQSHSVSGITIRTQSGRT